MKTSFLNDTLFWIILFSAIILFIGIHLTRSTPIVPFYPENPITTEIEVNPNSINDQNIEYFSNMETFKDESNSTQVSSGASTYYKWGLPDNDTNISISLPHFDYDQSNDKDHPFTPDCVDCDSDDDGDRDDKRKKKCCPKKKKSDDCVEKKESNYEMCKTCDITMNKDIDKYVLKSSVPPCPDMSEYAKKNTIHPDINLNEWIRKSDVEPCQKVDMNEFIRKSEIPACPPPVTCPTCPICPKPQPAMKCKKVNEFKIVEHPDIKNYHHKDEVKKMIDDAVNKIKKECSMGGGPQNINYSSEISGYGYGQQQQQSHNWNPFKRSSDSKDKPQTPSEGLYVGDSLFATV